MPKNSDWDWESVGLMIAGFVVAVFAALVLAVVLLNPNVSLFGSVAALILVGFAAFVVLMNVLSFSAHVLKITNGSQPFGLPEGSIRALLTLSFIVLVGVLAAFLVTTGGGRSQFEKDPRVLQRQIDLGKANEYAAAVKTTDGTVSVEPSGSDVKDKYDVKLYVKADNKLSDDIAKQILTMLSTILAAMIGFYFGARTDAGSGTGDPPADASPEVVQAASLLTRARKLRDDAAIANDPDKKQQLTGLIVDLGEVKAEIEGFDATLKVSNLLPEVKQRVQANRTAAVTRLAALSAQLDKLSAPAPGTNGGTAGDPTPSPATPPKADDLIARANKVKAKAGLDPATATSLDGILGDIDKQSQAIAAADAILSGTGDNTEKAKAEKDKSDANATLAAIDTRLTAIEKSGGQ